MAGIRIAARVGHPAAIARGALPRGEDPRDRFDFAAADGVNATQVHTLARDEWVTAPESLIFAGPIGPARRTWRLLSAPAGGLLSERRTGLVSERRNHHSPFSSHGGLMP